MAASENSKTEAREIFVDPAVSAERAGLAYVSDQEPGIRRKRWGRGFTYLDPEDGHVSDEHVRERIESLTIPPAWEDVWICLNPQGHIQATGRDSEGRKQYIYHPDWEHVREEVKFSRTVAFGEHLADLRRRCESELNEDELSREKVLAAVISLLDRTLARIGNEAYAEKNDSFGITTLRDWHVEFLDECCTFEFSGKSGKEHRIRLEDPRLARIVRRCRDVPGDDLFQYYDERGDRKKIGSADVNDFLKNATGQPFSAKDFRTWGASVHAADCLHEMDAPESTKEAEKQVVEMVKDVAGRLGNTPAVCRNYYIHPHIIEAHLDGSFGGIFREGLKRSRNGYLDAREKALLHFFRSWSGNGSGNGG